MKSKSFISTLALASIIAISSALPTVSLSATSIMKVAINSFSSAWELSESKDGGKLIYGYNTKWINEDYAYADHSNYSHYAAIYNGKGWHTGSSKSKGWTSKIEVTHSGSLVEYYCYW